MVLEMGKKRKDGWKPLVLKTEAIVAKEISDLVKGIYRHKQTIEQSRSLQKPGKE